MVEGPERSAVSTLGWGVGDGGLMTTGGEAGGYEWTGFDVGSS
jgi:hypothetical protein